MSALYSIETAPSDFLGTGTAEEPEVNDRTDGNGRTAVILGRITVSSGVPTFAWEPSTLTDMAYLGVQIGRLNPLQMNDVNAPTHLFSYTNVNGVLVQTRLA
jgi:hypothetical protein